VNEFKNTQQELSTVLGAEVITGALRDNLIGYSTDSALQMIEGLRHQSLEENNLLFGACHVLLDLLPAKLRDLDGIELAIADLIATHTDCLRQRVLLLQSEQNNLGGASADVSKLQRHQTCEAIMRTACS
jgi:hypothetical protein